MTAASDLMARAFDVMAGVFCRCSWMTALFDCVAGGIGWLQGLLAVRDAGK